MAVNPNYGGFLPAGLLLAGEVSSEAAQHFQRLLVRTTELLGGLRQVWLPNHLQSFL